MDLAWWVRRRSGKLAGFKVMALTEGLEPGSPAVAAVAAGASVHSSS